MNHSLVRIWKWPILIGCATVVGLLAALLGDDGWDWVSAGMLGVPVGVIMWRLTFRRSSQ